MAWFGRFDLPPRTLARRQFLAAALAGGAMLGRAQATGGTGRGGGDLRPLRVAVSGLGSFYALPVALALQLGYFRHEGVDVRLLDASSGAQALQMVAGGQADLVCAGYEHVLRQHRRGLRWRSFVMQGRSPQLALGVSVKGAARLRDPAAWRGLRIGVAALGDSGQLVAALALARQGIRPFEVSWLAVGRADGAVDALRSGQIDALCMADPLMTLLERRGEVVIAADTRHLQGVQWLFGGAMPAACLMASDDWLLRQHEAAQALANAAVRALAWLRTAGAVDLVRVAPEDGRLGGTRALFLTAFDKLRETYSADGYFPPSAALVGRQALQTLEAGEPTDGAHRPGSWSQLDLAQTYTNALVAQAKERYRL